MRPATENHECAEDRRLALVQTLASQRVVVTRGLAAGERLVERLGELGVNVVHCPCIAARPPRNPGPLTDAATHVARFDWLLFTSANAVQAFSRELNSQRISISNLTLTVGVVGSATGAVARAAGWTVAFTPSHSSGTALAHELPLEAGQRILLPRSDIASTDMPTVLRERGAEVTEVVAYRTVDAITDQTAALLRDTAHIDAITFTSPSTVRHLLAAALRAGWNVARAQRDGLLSVVCIGETTAEEVRRHGLTADTIARNQSSDGLIDALAESLRRRARTPRRTPTVPWSN